MAAPNIHEAAVHQRDLQPINPAASTSVAKAARPAGVRRDASANACSPFRRVRRIELTSVSGGGLQLLKQHPRAGGGVTLMDLEPAKFLERHRPTSLCHAAARDTSCRARNRDRNGIRRRTCKDWGDFGGARRHKELVGFAAKAGGIFLQNSQLRPPESPA